MARIQVKRTRYVVPFYIENSTLSFDALIESLKNSKSWEIQKEFANCEHDLYKSVLNNITNTNNNIGCCFLYKLKNLPKFFYPENNVFHQISISDLGLVYFRTKVGFVWYEVNSDFDDVKSIEDFQHDFKELSHDKITKLQKRKKLKKGRYIFEIRDKNKKEPLLMGSWLKQNIFNNISYDVRFFAERDNTEESATVPDKALLFNYTIFNKTNKKEDILNAIFHLNNGYDQKYKRVNNFENLLVEPFSGTYFYAASGGCGYYAVSAKDQYKFFNETLKEKIIGDYFCLYIIVLYQQYSILKFTHDISYKLSADRTYYEKNSTEVLQMIKELEMEINIFLVKSIYTSVSYVHHQNTFYEYLVKQFKIKESISSLNIGLNSLQKLQEDRENEQIKVHEDKINAEKEVSEGQLNIILAIISIVSLINIIPDTQKLVDYITQMFNLSVEVSKTLGVLLTVVTLIIVFIAFVVLVNSAKKLNKTNKNKK